MAKRHERLERGTGQRPARGAGKRRAGRTGGRATGAGRAGVLPRKAAPEFDALAEATPDLVIRVDRDLRVSYVNPAAARAGGRRAGQCIGLTIADSGVPPATAREWEDQFRAVFRSGRVVEAEHEFPTPAGIRCFLTTLLPERARDGTVTSVLSIARDITERKLAEEALRQSEEKHRMLLTAASDLIFVIGSDDTVRYANPAALEHLGRPEDQVMGQPRARFFPPHVATEQKRALDRVFATDEPLLRELPSDARGEVRWQETHLIPLKDREGRVDQVLGITRDVTGRKREQAEREMLVARLAQADRLASVGRLASGVAHEINNPLTYVIFNLESLAEDLPVLLERRGRGRARRTIDQAALDDVMDRLRDASSGARKIGRIVSDLGMLARDEAREAAPVDVEAAVELALGIAAGDLKHRARLTREFSGVPMVLGSKGRLAKVFLNLLVNAARAIDEDHAGGNEIRVRTFLSGDTVCIEVSDTGKGIRIEDQPRVFDPFFTTMDEGEGSGLGLWIARNIVVGLSGKIDVESEPGKGTRFTVRLPRAADDTP